MKFKKLIAALCCISLCSCADAGTSYGYSSYSSPETTSVTEYEELYYPETLATTAATTKATTAATTEKPFTGYVPVINNVVIDAEIKMVIIEWEVPGVADEVLDREDYQLWIYMSDSKDSYGEKFLDQSMITNFSMGDAESGTYYYRVELCNDKYSNISEPYAKEYVRYKNPNDEKTEEIHQYTHTFSAPEGFTVVADYTSALKKINNGEQPTEFEYTIYFTCPGCGNKKTIYPLNAFPYDRDGISLPIRVRCGLSRCPRGSEYIDLVIYSYATQIS